MRMNVDLRALEAEAKRISKTIVDIDIGKLKALDPINTTVGLEVPIDDVEFTPLATYQGKQVILFIPDHSYGTTFDDAQRDPSKGNRFHLTDCNTLENMRIRNRFKRYFATTHLSGNFTISSGDGRSAEVRLQVCQNCLKKLNYQQFEQNKWKVLNSFNLEEFFAHYRTSFRSHPHTDNMLAEEAGSYAPDWRYISQQYRQNQQWRCERCGLDMRAYPHLLDVHHRNGNKRDNSTKNLQALCRECHCKQDMHGHIVLSEEEQQIFAKLRWDDIPF